MTTGIAISEAAKPATKHDLDSIRKRVESNPLAAAPNQLRHGVWRLWCCHQHLFPTPLPLAAAVGVWVREHGLHREDAAAILADFLSPGRMAQFKFASDLLASLAFAAQQSIARRKTAREATIRRQEASEAAPLSASDRERISGLLADLAGVSPKGADHD